MHKIILSMKETKIVFFFLSIILYQKKYICTSLINYDFTVPKIAVRDLNNIRKTYFKNLNSNVLLVPISHVDTKWNEIHKS